MESSGLLNNFRSGLVVIADGVDETPGRSQVWTASALDFLRKMQKAGVDTTVVGPRLPEKVGSKRSLRVLDRHEIIGAKLLESSKSHPVELRVLGTKAKHWTRIRSDACVVLGPYGVWPNVFPGWNSDVLLSSQAAYRWLNQYKILPGQVFLLDGSTNSALRMGCLLLDRGAKACYIVESGDTLNCWRAHRDRFLAKGGRVLVSHRVIKVASTSESKMKTAFLKNATGTMLLEIDAFVLFSANQDALSSPTWWRRGLFYLQRRSDLWDFAPDEESYLEKLDWQELYWRVLRYLRATDQPEAEGAIKHIRADRRAFLEYRKSKSWELSYSGKILSRESSIALAGSGSVPRNTAREKPVASLECFEEIACRACVDACPETAISKMRLTDLPKLAEDLCTGCGACVAVCPASAAVMVREIEKGQKATYFLPDDSREFWRGGETVQMLNRRGEILGTGRVAKSTSHEAGMHRVLEIESNVFHLWEARAYRYPKPPGEELQTEPKPDQKRGWVNLSGARRHCPTEVPWTVSLRQLGVRRFEDALFCSDGSCGLCEIKVDGQMVKACKTTAKEGQVVDVEQSVESTQTSMLCPCQSVTLDSYNEFLEEGAPKSLIDMITGLGKGTCRGRWCKNSTDCRSQNDTKSEPRPEFPGFESAPWRELTKDDLID